MWRQWTRLLIALFLCVLLAHVCDGKKKKKRAPAPEIVEKVTSETYLEKTKDTEWMFLFRFDGCTKSCDDIHPLFNRVAQRLKDEDGIDYIKFGEINCSESAEVCQVYNVYSYPNLSFLSDNGQNFHYEQQHKAQKLIDYIKEKSAIYKRREKKAKKEAEKAKKEKKEDL